MSLDKFFEIFGIIVALLFFVLGVYLLTSKQFAYIPQIFRVIFSIVLFLYGIYRIVRIVFKQKKEE